MAGDENPAPNAYTRVIDLTERAQDAARAARAAESFAEPDPPLPDATPEGLPDAVRQAFDATGWPSLMLVQQKALPYMLDRRDLIVQSRTGSGKTGAFLLPLFDALDPTEATTQALVMAPTRELARQIHAEFLRMNQGFDEGEKLKAILVYGGVAYGPQVDALTEGTQLVIGTPGRILDHLERGTFDLDHLRVLILDEADEMLSMGFYPAMRQLKRFLPEERQSYMFSATMPPKVRSLGRIFLHEPGFLALSIDHVGVDAIEHRYYAVDRMEKDRVLVRLIEMENPDSAIIFANTKREVEYLHQFLRNYGYDADAISGDLRQKARERVMDRIRRGKLRFLVATDVAARGIDISDLSHVFMYDVPDDDEYYIHRSGRTARAGKTGTAIVLATYEDEKKLLGIAHRYELELEKREIPSPTDVEHRVAERMTEVMEEQMRRQDAATREHFERIVPLIKRLAEDAPASLAMLVDGAYHHYLHVERDEDEPAEMQIEPLPEPEEDDETDAYEGLATRMQEMMEDKIRRASNLRRERMRRFEPLVEELLKEEPELLAMLAEDAYQRHLSGPDPRNVKSYNTAEDRLEDNRGGGRRGEGRRGGGGGGGRRGGRRR